MKLKKFFVWAATFFVWVGAFLASGAFMLYRYPAPEGVPFLYALGFRFGQATRDPYGLVILALAVALASSAALKVKHE